MTCVQGCGQPKVHVRTKALANISNLRTYAWCPGEGDIVGVYGSRQRLAGQVMRQSIDEGLARQGFRPAAGADADVLVVYQLGVRSRREVKSLRTVAHNGETIAVPDEVTVYRAGTIVIYLLDPKLNDVVWVGTASAEAKAADSDSTARTRLRRGVRAVFDAMETG
jgi:hypothetical protein